jgi:hypothetical protein
MHMLKDDTIERLTEMMYELAGRTARRRILDTMDLLCWTPLAPMIRAARRARVHEQTRDLRMHQRAAEICAEVRDNHADLLVPAW